ncbi:efflux RND transporter periplasmic adaptor subunit [Aliikangiella sp. IMCC44359]|uniref:efflux RND transporter periplasmic adaptor subunit n=1 Tax=Aliikangiella sp. IMCC44359 TaxID=3459125 RepID=UPI00403A9C48
MQNFIRFIILYICCFSLIFFSQLINAKQESLVTVEKVKQELIAPSIWLPGNVISRRNARLSTEQNGRLDWILDIGSEVKKDQAVAQLDSRFLELQVAEKNAELRQNDASIIYLKTQQKRLKALLNNNSTTLIEHDRVKRDFKIAQEQRAVLKVQIQQIELAIEKTTIRAPFSGVVNHRLAQQGEYVTIGTPLIQLIDPISVDISIATPLALKNYLSSNSTVMVKWDDHLKAVPIRTWSPAGEQSSRTFNVLLDATGLNLISGQGVRVSLPNQTPETATMIPRDALILRDKESFVVTVDKKDVAHKIKVDVGQGINEWIAVSGSVKAGDRVVIRGGERLESGQKVRIKATELDTNASNIAAKL